MGRIDLDSFVPILGRVVEAYECIPIVTARCLCHLENQPFVLRGVELVMSCPRCRKVYGIINVTYQRGQGHTTANAEIGPLSGIIAQPSAGPALDPHPDAAVEPDKDPH